MNSKHGYRRFLVIAAAYLMGMPHFALAQTLPQSAEPARALPAPTMEVNRSEAQSVAPNGVAPALSAPKGAEAIFLTLQDIQIDGPAPYNRAEILSLYQNRLHQKIALSEVFDIANKIQSKYRKDGYVLTRVIIPPQDVTAGRIRLVVAQPSIGTIDADGVNKNQPAVASAISAIRSAQTLNTKELERQLLLLSDLTGQQVSAVLSSPKNTPNTLDITLHQTPQPFFQGNAGLNNYGSVFAGPVQAKLDATYLLPDWNYSRLGTSITWTPFKRDIRSISVSFDTPLLGGADTILQLRAQAGKSVPADHLKSFDVRGLSQNFSANIRHSTYRQRDGSTDIFGGFFIKNASAKFLGNHLYQDRVRTVEIGTETTLSDSFGGQTKGRFVVGHGLDILGSRPSGSIELSREDGKTDFTKFNAAFSHLHPLYGPFSLLLATEGQYSKVPLLSAEEFGFGGMDFGRGYDSSEITGDKGIAAKAELRLNTFIGTDYLQPYIFYDFGKVWNLDPLDKNRKSAASTGAGFRYQMHNGISFNGTVAAPLTHGATNPPAYASSGHSVRALFGVNIPF